MIEKGIYDKGFIWNPSICDGECNKSYDVEEYIDYEKCKCRKRLTDKLVEECREDIDGNEMTYKNEKCTIYIALLVVFFIISIGISTARFILIGT